ncbi:PREDICTED: uncharacterized protein LOC109220937 [Nicotiana attenuata]|uniref:Uncharacterized protein n=1 Tax=Nicotiana attenuata TaxID=49451 RepID=A0A1J6JRP0_NICAT|nr:PREDICTED: uncharacterized protein LOC109220937 [Nicotiana attenuata]OIT19862.1 hypothetical protein A4A49_39839 [Nicotiana attenuata]
MAESTQPIKRSREEESQETQENFCEDNNTKRHKSSYNDILSILEEEEYGFESDPVSGSDIFTTLQQELLPSDGFESDPVSVGSDSSHKEDEVEDDRSSVIRHLLEASDDELGIPSGDGTNGGDFTFAEENETNGGDFPFALADGLWEFEDEAANYYSLLQSELFM